MYGNVARSHRNRALIEPAPLALRHDGLIVAARAFLHTFCIIRTVPADVE